MLTGLVLEAHRQINTVAGEPDGQLSKLSDIMDALNKHYGCTKYDWLGRRVRLADITNTSGCQPGAQPIERLNVR